MIAIDNAMRYGWETWLIGIWRAVVTGGANGVLGGLTTVGIDPSHFNFNSGLRHTLSMMGAMFLVSGLISMFVFLQTHGAPDQVPCPPNPNPVVVTKGQV